MCLIMFCHLLYPHSISVFLSVSAKCEFPFKNFCLCAREDFLLLFFHGKTEISWKDSHCVVWFWFVLCVEGTETYWMHYCLRFIGNVYNRSCFSWLFIIYFVKTILFIFFFKWRKFVLFVSKKNYLSGQKLYKFWNWGKRFQLLMVSV